MGEGLYISQNLAERDDELRRLMIEADQHEAKLQAIRERIKLLLGLKPARRARSRYSQADLEAMAGGGGREHPPARR